MNRPFLFSAAAVLIAGAVVFAQQSRRLTEVRGTSVPPAPATAPNVSARPWAPPPAKPPEPEGRLLDRLGERLVESLDPAQVAVFLEAADAMELGHIALAAHLSAEERKAFEEKFAAIRHEQSLLLKRTGLTSETENSAWKNLSEQKKAWVTAQLGPERAAKMEESKKAFAQAGAEHDAARLVSRISHVADLTPEQKDRLYATFVERAQNPPPSPDQALKFRVSVDMREEPAIPDISEEAGTILTPEQLAAHKQSIALAARQNNTLGTAAKGMAPSVITTLQEFLNEPPPPAEKGTNH